LGSDQPFKAVYVGYSDRHHYYVYLVASHRRVLYCGMTNNLRRRVGEHKERAIPGFTALYRCDRLVWCQQFQYVYNAIAREKEIKSWTRAKKIRLIEEINPLWSDLSDAWMR
jgi:putative endonuclease